MAGNEQFILLEKRDQIGYITFNRPEKLNAIRWEDYILLDNMTLDELRNAVEMRGKRLTPRLEASGGVNLDTVKGIATTGVDFISVGAITHSAVALDLGLDFVPLDNE